MEDPLAKRLAAPRRSTSAEVDVLAQRAGAAVEAAGGSPRAQIDAARAVTGQHFAYLPHQGRREIARRRRRLAAIGVREMVHSEAVRQRG